MSDNTKENKTVETQEETVQETVSETATIETTDDSTEATSDSSVASAEDVVTNSDNKEQDKPSLEQETVSDTTEPESGATTSVASFADKAKQLFQDGQWYKNKKILAAIIAVVGIFVWFGINSGPQSVINDVNVTFSGYSSRGEAKLVKETADKKIKEIIAKKVGIPNWSGDTSSSSYASYLQYADKYALALAYYNDVSISVDRSSNLSNGDEVVVTITTPKDHPVKSETKTFKVEGLTEFQKVTVQDLIGMHIQWFGHNGNGGATLSENSEYSNSDFSLVSASGAANGRLKNGDVITLKASNSLRERLETKGKQLTDNSEYVITVSGLKEVSDIANISEVISRNDDVARTDNRDSDGYVTFTIIPEKTYFKVTNEGYSISTYSESLAIMTIYKITKKLESSGESKTYYKLYGHSDIKITNDNIDVSNLSSKKSTHYTEYTDLEAAESYLRSSDYSEYTAK